MNIIRAIIENMHYFFFPNPKPCVHLWDIYHARNEVRCMKCKCSRPSCFKSNPGPQSQAENCCEDCDLQTECIK